MSFSFSNILVPVDFSVNTETAVKKAIELSEEGTCIHLLHVLRQGYLKGSKMMDEEAGSKLLQWKTSMEEMVPHVRPAVSISYGNIQKAITERALRLKPDLIVVGKNSNHFRLPFLNTVTPGDLAEHTGCCVLTAKPGAMYNKVKILLVPVTGPGSSHKMRIIAALCKKFKVLVHLVTFADKHHRPEDLSASSLLQVYQCLKNSRHCQVECAVLHGYNKAKSLLAYAGKVNADMLLVHPQTETRVGWLNTRISDVLPALSKVQILAVQPVPNDN